MNPNLQSAIMGEGYLFAALFTYWARDIDAHINNMGLLVIAPSTDAEILRYNFPRCGTVSSHDYSLDGFGGVPNLYGVSCMLEETGTTTRDAFRVPSCCHGLICILSLRMDACVSFGRGSARTSKKSTHGFVHVCAAAPHLNEILILLKNRVNNLLVFVS